MSKHLGTIWQRDDRAFVYQHEGRTRYPSITRTAEGRMVVLFTRQTAEQEKSETGDLVLVPRNRGAGGSWRKAGRRRSSARW